MELTPRKKAVLAAIVREYIETGEPVGSRILSELLENAPSTATLRNEMNELCGLGYLSQPHTSAGRVPTSLAYRMYVESLMKPSSLGDSAKNHIDMLLNSGSGSPEEIPRAAAESLSELTGYPSFYSYNGDKELFFKKIQLMHIGRRSVVVLGIISDGRTQSRMCRLPYEVTKEFEVLFENTVKEKILRKSLSSLDPASLQSLVASLGEMSLDMLPLFSELFKMAQSASRPFVSMCGAAKLYEFSNGDSVRKISSLVSAPEIFLSVLDKAGKDKEVIFGSDTVFPELSDKTLIVSDYESNGIKSGKIGIIGPYRMPYESIIPSVEYAADELSKLMTDAAKDLED